jgi:hypothetical protein
VAASVMATVPLKGSSDAIRQGAKDVDPFWQT